MNQPILPSPLQRLKWKRFAGIDLWVKRDDLIHPIISGNKWRKLKGIFGHGARWSERSQPSMILSFGGAYSHHLSALALCLEQYHCPGIFVIRGEELNPHSNLNLQFCAERGMRLIFVTRAQYRALRVRNWRLSSEERRAWNIDDQALILPEGGDAESAEIGCSEIWPELIAQTCRPSAQDHLAHFDEIWLCAGTGATARGLMLGMPTGCQTKVVIISAVKGAKQQEAQALELAQQRDLTCEWVDESFGGFGKRTPALMSLRQEGIYESTVWIDPIYQPKLWWALNERQQDLQGKRIVWLHTGGARSLCDAQYL